MLLLESDIGEFFPIIIIVLWVGFAVFGAIKTAKKPEQNTSKDFEMAKRRIEEIKRRNMSQQSDAERNILREEPAYDLARALCGRVYRPCLFPR